MLTPFGIAIRQLRLKKGLRLLDLARAMRRTSSFVSAVETGRKPMPHGYVEAVAKAMKLTDTETDRLRRAADRTKTELPVDKLTEDQRELVAAFSRKIDDVPTRLLDAVKKRVFKSLSDDVPFRRNRRGLLVPPVGTEVIRTFAEKVRSVFADDEQIAFPIIEVLELRMQQIFPDFYIDVQSREDMGVEEGRMIAGENCLVLREDVYEGACDDNGRDRFTACHELGHFLMHRSVSMARACEDAHPIYQDSEWQADTFAGSLMMSRRHLDKFCSAEDAAKKCGMTQHAAKVMWSKYQKEGRIKN